MPTWRKYEKNAVVQGHHGVFLCGKKIPPTIARDNPCKGKSDGDFVYSFNAERQNKGLSTRRTLHADDTAAESGSNAQPNTKLPQTAPGVKNQFMQGGKNYAPQAQPSGALRKLPPASETPPPLAREAMRPSWTRRAIASLLCASRRNGTILAGGDGTPPLRGWFRVVRI